MTGGLVVFMLAFAQTAHALKAPSADDLQYLHERMKAAYDRQAEADAAEATARHQARAGVIEEGWESRLPEDEWLELSRARTRAGNAWNVVMDQVIIAYGILPMNSFGSPAYPKAVMQGGEFKGQEKQWLFTFKPPAEGSVTGDDGKPLVGDKFQEFLKTTRGMTSPDGTTIIWGKDFRDNPAKMAQVLVHELSHYRLFASEHWVNDKTNAEREIKCHEISKSALKHFGLLDKERREAESEEDGAILTYQLKNLTERPAKFGRSLKDRFRELVGLPLSPKDPGFYMTDGIALRRVSLAAIRKETESLREATVRESLERVMARLAERACRNPLAFFQDEAAHAEFRALPRVSGEPKLQEPDECQRQVVAMLWRSKAAGERDAGWYSVANLADQTSITRQDGLPVHAQVAHVQYDTLAYLRTFAAQACASPPALEQPALDKIWPALPRVNYNESAGGALVGCERQVFLWLLSSKAQGIGRVYASDLARLVPPPPPNLAPAPRAYDDWHGYAPRYPR